MPSAKQAAKVAASHLQARGILLSERVWELWAVLRGFLCFQLLSNIPGWNNLGRADLNNIDGLSSWWPMVKEATMG